MPFEWTVNPYRGCTPACVYCFARKTHSYLDLAIGIGFGTQIVVKVNAPEVLRRQLASPRRQGEHIAMQAVRPHCPCCDIALRAQRAFAASGRPYRTQATPDQATPDRTAPPGPASPGPAGRRPPTGVSGTPLTAPLTHGPGARCR